MPASRAACHQQPATHHSVFHYPTALRRRQDLNLHPPPEAVLCRLSYVCKCLPWATSLRGALRSASYRPPVYPAVARSAPLPSGAGSRAGREEVSPCPRHPRLSPQEASNCKIFSSPLKRNTRERGLQFYIWNISCPSDSRKGDHPFERPPPDFPLPLSRRRGTIFPAWRTWSISTGFIASISMPLPIAARRLVDAAKTFARTIPAALPQWSRPFCQQHRSILTQSNAFVAVGDV